MQNNNESKIDESDINLSEISKKIEEKAKENLNPTEMEEMFSELKDSGETQDNVLSDLFYKSVQLIFDTGFDLAKKLNLDLFESFEFDEKKKES
jgi:hypothetical protein